MPTRRPTAPVQAVRLLVKASNTKLPIQSPTRTTQAGPRGRALGGRAHLRPARTGGAGVLKGLLAALAGSANTIRIWGCRGEFRSGGPRRQGKMATAPHSFNDAPIFTNDTGLVVGSDNLALAARAPRGCCSC